MADLTLRIIRNTDIGKIFAKLYSRQWSESDTWVALKVALLLINSGDEFVHDLGYRLILKISLHTQNFIPLFDVATHRGYVPIAAMLEHRALIPHSRSLSFELTSAYHENFKDKDIYQTERQKLLFLDFKTNLEKDVVVVAPTSYGKSQLIEEIVSTTEGNIAIVVPSKALIAQTRRRISTVINEDRQRIVVHHDMVLDNSRSIVAVVTQERLLRLYQKHTDLKFHVAFIDEAHNLLSGDRRARLLASTIIISKIRNPKISLKYLTPFLVSGDSISLAIESRPTKNLFITEKLKTELYYLATIGNQRSPKIYDQYLNQFFDTDKASAQSDIEYLHANAEEKNIVYLNRPLAIEHFATNFANSCADNIDPELAKFEKEISEFVHPSYRLLSCLRRGVAYHHGSVPDAVRNYIENYFRISDHVKWIITNSTLLEGVNIPASCLFILDPRKGLGNLTPSQFRNLVGRVNRFSEIFHPSSGHPRKLMPPVHLVVGAYCRDDLNPEDYLKKVGKVDRSVKDDIKNPLLQNVTLDPDILKKRQDDLTFIANIEPSSILQNSSKLAQTEVGKLCFVHNILEIDVFNAELEIQSQIDAIRLSQNVLTDSKELLSLVSRLFISKIPEDSNDRDIVALRRLHNPEARLFYSMFFDWRINQVNYRFMISSFISYWSRLVANTAEDALVFVGKWGDTVRGGYRPNYIDLRQKNQYELVNLAIVRIKEEQDFIDTRLVKFLEILNDLGVVHSDLYNKIKYGTTNIDQITLIRCGLSHIAANILVSSYRRYLRFGLDATVSIDAKILEAFQRRQEKEVVKAEIEWSGLLS